jgi:hypothetical protein
MRRSRPWTEEWHERVVDLAQAPLLRDHRAQGKEHADDIAATAEPEVVRVIVKGAADAGGGNLGCNPSAMAKSPNPSRHCHPRRSGMR